MKSFIRLFTVCLTITLAALAFYRLFGRRFGRKFFKLFGRQPDTERTVFSL